MRTNLVLFMLAGSIIRSGVAFGQTTRPDPTTALSSIKPTAPTAPKDTLTRLHLGKGFVAELMASEPLVNDPVAMAWGPDGKLWVVEMTDYPLGKNGNIEPSGRVIYLQDSQGDGRYDKATVFAENLNFPNGILPWRNGVIVTAAPDILYLEDTTGNGKADRKEVLYTGFTPGNPQLRVNCPTYGLDNWVYLANGLSSRGIARSMKTGAEVNASGHDIRVRPDEGLIETETGVSQYGRRQDDWGNWLGVDNSHPVRHFIIPERYARRNPLVQLPRGYDEAGLPPNGKVFPVSQGQKRYGYAFFEQSGHFTSACSLTPYRDDLLFGPSTSGLDHVFICEPAHNLVQHLLLKPSGTTFVAERADDEPFNEFLASEDNWCRPVFLACGPDGALWMVDMYRYFIDHPEFLPPDGKQDLRPYYRLGEGMGRIYRIYPGGKSPRAMPRLDKLDAAQLVNALETPSGWQHDMVRMMLVWRNDPATVGPLERMAQSSGDGLARMQALCTLDGMGRLRPELVERALSDPSPPVRRQAVRLAESRAKDAPALIDAAVRLADDPEPIVRLQLAFTLGEWEAPAAGKALARIALNADGDTYLSAAVMSSALHHYETVADALIAANKAGAATRDLLGMALAQNNRDLASRLLQPLLTPQHGEYETDQLESFGQFLDALPARRTSLAKLVAEKKDSLSDRLDSASNLFEAARRMTGAGEVPPERRVAAIALLGRDDEHKTDDLSSLAGLLAPATPPVVQTAAVKAMARIGSPEVPAALLRDWQKYPREVRSAVLDALIAREPWAYELLTMIESGKVPAADIDPARRQRLARHSSQRVRDLAEKTVGEASALSRTKVLKAYDSVGTLTPDPARGAKVFAQNCTTCHRLGTMGQEIGPNLQSVSGWTADALLVAILDPSRSAEPRYLSYNCTLTSGEVVYGLVSREGANGVTLKGIDAQERTIPRSQIKSLECTNRSLMPDGLEAAVDPQAMADLIRFLRSNGWSQIAPYFTPPPEYAGQFGDYRSPLQFEDGTRVTTAADWPHRRQEILAYWHHLLGPWPPLIVKPKIEYLETKSRENFTQRKVLLETAPGQTTAGYLLLPAGDGPFPAVFVPFYEAETSTGQNASKRRDFAYQLTRRGFVTLSIGSPGGDARKPDLAGTTLQPLSFLAYVAANAYNALASLPQVDPKRVGVVGHSYGGKWALFASCLNDKYAAAVWSDPGIVWDESRGNVNYWEPWYLGLDSKLTRKPGLITTDNPRTGAYKTLIESGHDLQELHTLMAPRPFLISGGSEDPPSRWIALNHAVAVNKLLGFDDRVGMTHRQAHSPTEESNEVIYQFFEHFLAGK